MDERLSFLQTFASFREESLARGLREDPGEFGAGHLTTVERKAIDRVLVACGSLVCRRRHNPLLIRRLVLATE
ncbi:MAG: hypothetical protein JXP34_15750 [Planctomycetes bacterium]|nr:hypothetical protein [Planctomycetota bacterium]